MKTDEFFFFEKSLKIDIFRVFGLKTGFFKVFQLFLKNGSNDFSDFLSKVSAQYRLTTGENHMFRKTLNFAPGGQKVKGQKISKINFSEKWSYELAKTT